MLSKWSKEAEIVVFAADKYFPEPSNEKFFSVKLQFKKKQFHIMTVVISEFSLVEFRYVC